MLIYYRPDLGGAIPSAFTGDTTETYAQRDRASQALIAEYHLTWVIITLGADGAEGFTKNEGVRVGLPAIKMVNSIGAGDSFTAGVAAWLHDKKAPTGSNSRLSDIGKACIMGAAAGTANCLDIKPGRFDIEAYRSFVGEIRIKE